MQERAKKKEAAKHTAAPGQSEAMEVEPPQQQQEAPAAGDSAAAGAAKPAAEPTSYLVANPGRVVPQQEKYLALPQGGRWLPVRQGKLQGGITVVQDTRPEEPLELVRGGAAQAQQTSAAAATPANAQPAAGVGQTPPAAPARAAPRAGGEDDSADPPPPAPFRFDG